MIETKRSLIKLLASALLLSAFGCTSIPFESPAPTIDTMEIPLTFEASMGGIETGAATRTGVQDDGHVYWMPGDEISVFFQSGEAGGSRFTSTATSNELVTTFSGAVTVFTGEGETWKDDAQFWAVYPYSASNRCDGTYIYTELPARQESPEDTFAAGQWPTMARSKGLNLGFYNICSGIKFTVANEGIRSITLRNIDGGSISGMMKVGWDSDNRPELQEITGGTDEIVVTPEGNGTFAVGKVYFAAVPAVIMSQGLEVTYRTASSKAVYTNSGSLTFNRGSFKKLTAKDSGLTFEPESHITPISGYELVEEMPADWSGRYIIVDPGKSYVFTGAATTPNAYHLADDDMDDDIITKDCSGYEFTIQKSGSSYYLIHGGQSLYYSSSGDKTTKMKYSTGRALNLSLMDDGTYGFYSSTQYIYFNGEYFKFGGSHGDHCVFLYRYGDSIIPQAKKQKLSFTESSITWVLGEDCEMGGTYSIQNLSGAQTPVSYTSSNPSVATVSGSQISIVGTGWTTITANAEETSDYCSATASYRLLVSSVRVYNLENSSVSAYLDDAESKYTDTNWSSVSVVESYTGGQSATNRLDAPAPVTVAWPASSGSGSYTVSVYNDSSLTDLEMSQSTSSTSADIINLVPDRTYCYTVTRGGNTVATGSFATEGRRRMLKVSDTRAIGHANNCRDLGGLTTTDGKTLKYNRIFRGTNMDATTTAEKEYLAGYMNIGLDVDLRSGTASSISDNGSQSANNAFNGSYGVNYVCGNFSGSISSFYTSDSNAKSSMTGIFTQIVSTVKAGKAAYIHCYVGADRTGYTCMLLEAVLGVSPKDCSIDFELTSFSVVGKRTRTGSGNRIGLDGYNYINGYKGSTFKEKAYNILIDYGVTSAQIEEFRSLMLE